jgi:cyanophycinase-like exopeptidase
VTNDDGRFLLLGSGEFEPWSSDPERFTLAGAAGDGSVAILATASGSEGQPVFDRWTAKGLAHYRSTGIKATALQVRTRADALTPDVAKPLDDASMVFFSGGKPSYLARTLESTPVWDGVLRLLERGGVFAGCSAGAIVAGAGGSSVSRQMPFPFASGLGLLPSTAFGVHWDAMSGWWIRWLRDLAPRRLPTSVGFIGIAENTAIATDGDSWRVFGAGIVEVRDGGKLRKFATGDQFPRRGVDYASASTPS